MKLGRLHSMCTSGMAFHVYNLQHIYTVHRSKFLSILSAFTNFIKPLRMNDRLRTHARTRLIELTTNKWKQVAWNEMCSPFYAKNILRVFIQKHFLYTRVSV